MSRLDTVVQHPWQSRFKATGVRVKSTDFTKSNALTQRTQHPLQSGWTIIGRVDFEVRLLGLELECSEDGEFGFL